MSPTEYGGKPTFRCPRPDCGLTIRGHNMHHLAGLIMAHIKQHDRDDRKAKR